MEQPTDGQAIPIHDDDAESHEQEEHEPTGDRPRPASTVRQRLAGLARAVVRVAFEGLTWIP